MSKSLFSDKMKEDRDNRLSAWNVNNDYVGSYYKWFKNWSEDSNTNQDAPSMNEKRMLIESAVIDFSSYVNSGGCFHDEGWACGEAYGVQFPGQSFFGFNIEQPSKESRFYNWYHHDECPGIYLPHKENESQPAIVLIRENMYQDEKIINKRQLFLSIFEEILLCHYYRSIGYAEMHFDREFEEVYKDMASYGGVEWGLDDKENPIRPWPLIIPAYYKPNSQYNKVKALSIYYDNKSVDYIIHKIPGYCHNLFGEFFGNEMNEAVRERDALVKEYKQIYKDETARRLKHNQKVLEEQAKKAEHQKELFEGQQEFLHDFMIKLGFCAGCKQKENHPYNLQRDTTKPACVCPELANEGVYITKKGFTKENK